MTPDFITVSQAVSKYQLNPSKLQLAIKNCSLNGLYKALYRRRTRIFFREDFFERWLKENDCVSASLKVGRGSDPKTTHLQSQRHRTS